MALHGKADASFSKSNHPAKKKGGMGLSGSVKKQGNHPGLTNAKNPVNKSKKAGESKSMRSMNPLFHPGNKMGK